jgi:hypothetical protein
MLFAFTIADILNQWQSIGVFDYLLPFLLIFALIYGVLTATNLFHTQKGLNVIIAVALAFMSLQLDFVSLFFRDLFPRLAVGIVILLTLLILVGMFVPNDEKRYWFWGFGAIAFIIFLVIVGKSLDQFSYLGSIDQYIGYIVGAVLIIGLIIAVAAGGGEKDPSKRLTGEMIVSPLFGNPAKR